MSNKPANDAPVIKHYRWRKLVQELCNRPHLKRLSRIVSKRAEMILSPAVSLAWWLANHHPELLQKGELHIVIGGAEMMDVTDHGMWYSLLPDLLGMPELKVTFDMVGPDYNKNLTAEFGSNYSLDTEFKGMLENHATPYKQTLNQYLIDHSTDSVDLLVLYQPGFDTHHDQWLSDNALAQFVNDGVPVLCSYYQESEYVLDRMILEAYGFSGIGEPIENPFKLETDNFASQAYHTLWLIDGSAQVPVHLRDNDKFIASRSINAYGAASFSVGYFSAIEDLLKREEAQSASETPKVNMVQLPFDFWLEEQSGNLYYQDQEGRLVPYQKHQLSEGELNSLPAHNAPLYDRVLWVSEIMLKYSLTHESLQREVSGASVDAMDSLLGGMYEEMQNDPEGMRDAMAHLLGNSGLEGSELNGHLDQMMQAMGMGPKLEIPESHSAIIKAMRLRDDESIRRFIEQDSQLVNAQDEQGVTPLYYAACSNNPELVEFLGKSGANPNHIDAEGWPIITEVVRQRAVDGLRALLAIPGIDLNSANYLGWNAALLALTNGQLELALLLKQAGADFEQVNSTGLSACQVVEQLRDEMNSVQYQQLSC